MIISIYSPTFPGGTISAVPAFSGENICLTTIADLPAGDHEIFLRLESFLPAGFEAAHVQVIIGQNIDERGCIEAREVAPE